MATKIEYPQVRRNENEADDFHGVKVPNPYNWLEDPDSEETKKFVAQQNDVTDPILQSCDTRETFKQRMTKLFDYPKHGCPFRKGKRYFHFYNTGLQNQSVMYVKKTLDGKSEVFLDPNTMDKDGLVAVSKVKFSHDGELCAYSFSKKGSDWTTIKFMKVETREEFSDILENVKFSCIAWTHDNKGIFYNRYDKDDGKQDGTETTSNLNQKLYYHYLGTPQSEDVLVCEAPDNPKWMIFAEVSDDGQYVVLTPTEGCDPTNRLYICDLNKINHEVKGLLPFEKIVDNFDASYEYITNEGSIFTFKTNCEALRYRVINIDLSKPSKENWINLVAEHEQDVLEWMSCVNKNVLVMCYMHDVKDEIYFHHLENGERYKKIDLDVGSVTGYSGMKHHEEIFYAFSSFLTPAIIYRYSFTDEGSSTVYHQTKIEGFEASDYETKQIFYKSKDGTKIPMFIINRKGLTMDGNNPCVLYGYGGFSISITPGFSVTRTMFIGNYRGVYAIANIRGGGEYGEQWHKDGCFEKRQNAYDDFAAGAEYLIENKYTSKEKLTITGGSNGGLLVTACANQRPDLFKCVVAHVSVCDMLKFHRYTIGHAWTTDFGCSDKKEDFEFLYKYSPLHTIRSRDDCQYPCLLMLTADHDDRVVPLHSFKFIAELQHTVGRNANQVNPLLIRIDTESGHGAGKPTSKVIQENSDVYGFIAKMVGAKWHDC